MGQFIDTQQGLLSEAKQKRLDREHKKLDKERHERQELELYYSLENMLYNTPKSTKQKQKQELEKIKTRDFIIDKITGGDLKDGYILTQKYNTLLNKAYKPYNDEKNNYKQLEIKLHRTLKNTLERKEIHLKTGNKYFKTEAEAYYYLLEIPTKNHIINMLSNDIEERYKLDKKYITILDNLYKPYKRTQKQVKTIIKTELQTQTVKQEKQKAIEDVLKSFFDIIIEIIKIFSYIFIVPLVFIISFFIHKK